MERCAVVTGASSGLGEEFARRFAAAGEDLVLVARRRDRLERLAEQLRAEHGVTVTVLDADLAAPNGPQSVVDRIAAAGLKPTALINSAGFGTAEPFVGEDPVRIAEEIDVNVRALTVLSRLLLPALLAAPAGILVNVASIAAYQPIPTIAVYAASKAYVLALTEAIWYETRGTGLRVLALCPGPTATGFFDVAGTDRFAVGPVVSCPEVVDAAWQNLGRSRQGPTLVVGRRNRVQALAARLLPRRLVLAVTARSVSGGHR